MEQSDVLWLKSFEQNLLRNRQLSFSRGGFLSYVAEGSPKMFQFILHSVSVSGGLRFFADVRRFREEGEAAAGFHFPLTRERFTFEGQISKIKSQEDIEAAWANLSPAERSAFASAAPGAPVDVQTLADKFNAQPIEKISENFAIFELAPKAVDHLVQKMPEVVADARNPVFESEFKPYKTEKRYIFSLDAGLWKVKQVNP